MYLLELVAALRVAPEEVPDGVGASRSSGASAMVGRYGGVRGYTLTPAELSRGRRRAARATAKLTRRFHGQAGRGRGSKKGRRQVTSHNMRLFMRSPLEVSVTVEILQLYKTTVGRKEVTTSHM